MKSSLLPIPPNAPHFIGHEFDTEHLKFEQIRAAVYALLWRDESKKHSDLEPGHNNYMRCVRNINTCEDEFRRLSSAK